MVKEHGLTLDSALLYSNNPIPVPAKVPAKGKSTKKKTTETKQTKLDKIEEAETELRQAKKDGKPDTYITSLQQYLNILLQPNGKEYIAFISCHLPRVCSVPEVSSAEEEKSNDAEVRISLSLCRSLFLSHAHFLYN
jgi:hypothetical protein